MVSYFPHMHLRDPDTTLTAHLPDARKQTLLSVPNYDFNWQRYYFAKAPVPLPSGTIVQAVAHYDNSADNPHNPDPTRDVTFGEQSTDKMMFGVFDFTPKDGVSPTPTTPEKRMDVLATTFPKGSAYRTEVTARDQNLHLSLVWLSRASRRAHLAASGASGRTASPASY